MRSTCFSVLILALVVALAFTLPVKETDSFEQERISILRSLFAMDRDQREEPEKVDTTKDTLGSSYLEENNNKTSGIEKGDKEETKDGQIELHMENRKDKNVTRQTNPKIDRVGRVYVSVSQEQDNRKEVIPTKKDSTLNEESEDGAELDYESANDSNIDFLEHSGENVRSSSDSKIYSRSSPEGGQSSESIRNSDVLFPKDSKDQTSGSNEDTSVFAKDRNSSSSLENLHNHKAGIDVDEQSAISEDKGKNLYQMV